MGLLTEQLVDFIVVLVAPGFSQRSDPQQLTSVRLLTGAARRAGLQGTVVPVWDGGGGRMAFRAPALMHDYFGNIRLATMTARLDRVLCWDQISRIADPSAELTAALTAAFAIPPRPRSTGLPLDDVQPALNVRVRNGSV